MEHEKTAPFEGRGRVICGDGADGKSVLLDSGF
jgi:hypothetical protein